MSCFCTRMGFGFAPGSPDEADTPDVAAGPTTTAQVVSPVGCLATLSGYVGKRWRRKTQKNATMHAVTASAPGLGA
jgi:hypothetical protein